MTLQEFSAKSPMIEEPTTAYIVSLAEARGKQELYMHQSPQKLKHLREHALIESAISSNRIEGVEVEMSRIGTLMFGKPSLHNRDEEEVRGYRDALNLIHEKGVRLPINEKTILRLHKLCRGNTWDAGKYKDKNVDIIQTYSDGSSRIRFKTVSAEHTPHAIAEMVELWNNGMRDHRVNSFILAAALNLDFLCIHPFRDGNGRVSRLLLLLAAYHCGLDVGRYISIERLIEQHKERYYEVLEQSSQGWHKGKHNPWHTINFLLFILTEAYKEFERRIGQMKSQRGEKTQIVENAIAALDGEFGLSTLELKCPGVSRDMIRVVLRTLKAKGIVSCRGHGPAAKWMRKGNTL